ncbi:hypothetical protein N9335_03125 [Crocinitomicaceae bacterium]|nr:hypothetical protein [Crocinitomicaceae bacterium]
MLKYIIVHSFLALTVFCNSQPFKYKHSFSKKSNQDLWIPDNTGNIYLYADDILDKKSLGQLPDFSQSIKSMGDIDQILPINALKTYLFSQTQQQICLIDNTLSVQSKCIDLEEMEIQYALFCAVSGRPHLIYVYDQFNSTLFLINTKSSTIIQKVSNLEGVLNMDTEISEIKEHNNDLFIRTISGKVYQLDMFLNLKKEIPNLHKELIFYKEFIVDWNDPQIKFIHLESEDEKVIPLEDIRATELKIMGNSFYFSTKYEIRVFEYYPD